MKLIVGLGNPGKEYDMTRHNTGFYCLDVLSDEMNQSIDKEKFKGLYTKFKYKGEDVILLKPQTYMNNSGESVAAVMQFFKIPVEDLLVIYDDMDMPTGKLRLREKGSAGGHNGIKSIIQEMWIDLRLQRLDARLLQGLLLLIEPLELALQFHGHAVELVEDPLKLRAVGAGCDLIAALTALDAGGGIAQVPRFSAPPLARSME